jgi:transcriptional regulator with XRE-family HTH domain
MKSDFGKLCRALRVERHLKQREVAAAIGIAVSTCGNLESSQFKTIRRERAESLADFYKLTGARRAAFLDAWDRCPVNPITEQLRKKWDRHHTTRARLKHLDVMHAAFLEYISLTIPYLPDGAQCRCEFGGGTAWDPTRNCDLCVALEAVGIPEGWSGKLKTQRRISEVVHALDAKAAAAAAYAAKFKKGSTNGKPA